jgi:orotate phosphoribosyltransferase
MRDAVLALLSAEEGHFVLESGYHARLWMDLETLFLDPRRIEPLAIELAARVATHEPEVVCGPLVEGAFLALAVARHLGVPFTYTVRSEAAAGGLYPYAYRLPRVLRAPVAGKRVAIINDVISAGSAVRGTFHDLADAGARAIAVGALLLLGGWTRTFGAEHGIAIEALAEEPFELWRPEACPLCDTTNPLPRA